MEFGLGSIMSGQPVAKMGYVEPAKPQVSLNDRMASILGKGALAPVDMTGFNKMKSGLGSTQGETPWYQDNDAMAGYSGLAGSLLQAVALPGQMKLAKTQRQGLEQNLRQAKIDSAFKATARANLNAPRLGA